MWEKENKNLQGEDGDYLDERFASMNLRVYDKTSDRIQLRMLGIIDSLMRFNADCYVILDDERSYYEDTPLWQRCVFTDYYGGGLRQDVAEKVIDILNRRL